VCVCISLYTQYRSSNNKDTLVSSHGKQALPCCCARCQLCIGIFPAPTRTTCYSCFSELVGKVHHAKKLSRLTSNHEYSVNLVDPVMFYLAFVLNSLRGGGNGVLMTLFKTAISDAAPIC
jgi:hypothetical protein